MSVLDPEGVPTIVQQTKIRPPESRMGPATKPERKTVFEQSPIKGVYDETVDRESASEKLKARTEEAAQNAEKEVDEEREYKPAKPKSTKPKSTKTKRKSSSGETTTQTVVKSATRMVTSSLGQSIIRGIMGSIFKGR